MSNQQIIKKSVLIVETGVCHFELIPTWVYLFDKCGYDVYLNVKKHGNRNITPILLKDKLRYTEVSDPHNVWYDKYNVVIQNTFYPTGKIGALPKDNQKCKLKGNVVHVISNFADNQVKSNNHILITLANHMNNESLKYTPRTTYLYPIYFRNPTSIPSRVITVPKRVFVVQGTFDSSRRNYKGLMDVLKSLKDRNDFVVLMMGSGGNMLQSLKGQLSKLGVSDKVKFETNVGYNVFFDRLWNSHFILPLVDSSSSVRDQYFKSKITSSIMASVGNLLPMVGDKAIGDLYGLSNGVDCLTYTNMNGFKDAMIKAITMNQEDYNTMVSNVKVVYDKWMNENVNNINTWFPR